MKKQVLIIIGTVIMAVVFSTSSGYSGIIPVVNNMPQTTLTTETTDSGSTTANATGLADQIMSGTIGTGFAPSATTPALVDSSTADAIAGTGVGVSFALPSNIPIIAAKASPTDVRSAYSKATDFGKATIHPAVLGTVYPEYFDISPRIDSSVEGEGRNIIKIDTNKSSGDSQPNLTQGRAQGILNENPPNELPSFNADVTDANNEIEGRKVAVKTPDPSKLARDRAEDRYVLGGTEQLPPDVRIKVVEAADVIISGIDKTQLDTVEGPVVVIQEVQSDTSITGEGSAIKQPSVDVFSLSSDDGIEVSESFGALLERIEEIGADSVKLFAVVSTNGFATVFSASSGVLSFIGFLQGPEFNLADLLKMVTKSIKDAQPPLKKERKDLPSAAAGLVHYLQYIILAAVFVILKKKAQKIDLDMIYAAAVANVNREKETIRLIVKVKLPNVKHLSPETRNPSACFDMAHHKSLRASQSTETSRKFSPKASLISGKRADLHSKELAELDMDVNKRLNQMKYWANYLSSMQKRK